LWRIRWHREPMRIEMGTHKAQLLHCVLQFAQALHSSSRIYACESGKSVRMPSAGVRDHLVRDLKRALNAQVARARSDKQRALNSCPIHLLQISFESDTIPN